MAKTLKYLALGFTAFFFFAIGGLPNASQAASLSLSPASGVTTVGTPFTVTVLLGTEGITANAVDVALSFPADKLTVSGISTANSVLSLWVHEPSYSNTSGLISFTGGAPRPGFNGSALVLVTITFIPKVVGSSTVMITNSSVLSGDGTGTELLKSFSGSSATFTMNPAPPPTGTGGASPAPTAPSSTPNPSVAPTAPAGAPTIPAPTIPESPSAPPEIPCTPAVSPAPVTPQTTGAEQPAPQCSAVRAQSFPARLLRTWPIDLLIFLTGIIIGVLMREIILLAKRPKNTPNKEMKNVATKDIHSTVEPK